MEKKPEPILLVSDGMFTVDHQTSTEISGRGPGESTIWENSTILETLEGGTWSKDSGESFGQILSACRT